MDGVFAVPVGSGCNQCFDLGSVISIGFDPLTGALDERMDRAVAFALEPTGNIDLATTTEQSSKSNGSTRTNVLLETRRRENVLGRDIE